MIFAASAFDHVLDSLEWHVTDSLHIHLPGFSEAFGGKGFGITKYSILMMLAAIIIAAIYIPLAKKIRTGEAPVGTFWNLFESVLVFIRNEIAKPYIGADADYYVPHLWTVFLFVLTCNLLGMFPFMGSPTASIAVTGVLAFGVFVFIHVVSAMRFGTAAHLKSFAPQLDVPFALKILLWCFLWPIEFIGLGLKCFVLAVRLFANMFAGHMVLATVLLFIPAVRNTNEALEWSVTVGSVLGVLALSFLELFVAFLQAYLFTFLTALFFGGILEHAEHAAHSETLHDAGEEDVHLQKTGAQHH